MKKTILFIASILFIISVVFPQSKVNIKYLDEYGGKKFKQNDDKPFTGIVFDLSKETGNKISETKYVQGIPHGKHVEWNNDGKKKVEGTYKSGIMDGKWTYYTDVGNGKYEVTYKAGIYTVAVFTDSLGTNYTGMPIFKESEQDGTYLFRKEEKYDFSKFPEFFATVKDGKKDGLWTLWYENGQKEEEGPYNISSFGEKGDISYKTGKWTYWYENGQKWREGSHSSSNVYLEQGEGVEVGTWSEWYENGQKRAEYTYKDGKLDGLCTAWHDNGQKEEEGTSKAGKQDGLWTEWYDNGQKKSEETYKDGKLDGLCTGWHDNGQKRAEYTYKDGKQDELWTWWYKNGQKRREDTFKDGKKDGLYNRWHKNGQKNGEGTYKDGEEDGLWTTWYFNGQKMKEGTYKDSEMYLKWTYWNENGQKKSEVIYWDVSKKRSVIKYKDGEMISQECWDEDGNECECNDHDGCLDYVEAGYFQVPNLLGLNQKKAVEILKKSGFRLGKVFYRQDEGVTPYTVLDQSISAETYLEKPTTINLTVSVLDMQEIFNQMIDKRTRNTN